MGGIFSYDSKLMQVLNFIGDLILLNMLYLLCCLPIFTIGAAQAGLYTACKVLMDKEDDSSPYEAFFKGFKTGFGTVTLAWGIVTLVLIVVVYFVITAILLGAPAWLAGIAALIIAFFQALIPAFHARFSCKWWQLIRNSWFLLFAHPLRSIGVTLLLWMPVISLYFINLWGNIGISIVWLTLYYSTACCFATVFLKKPFKVLTDHFNETHPTENAESERNPNAVFRDAPELETGDID